MVAVAAVVVVVAVAAVAAAALVDMSVLLLVLLSSLLVLLLLLAVLVVVAVVVVVVVVVGPLVTLLHCHCIALLNDFEYFIVGAIRKLLTDSLPVAGDVVELQLRDAPTRDLRPNTLLLALVFGAKQIATRIFDSLLHITPHRDLQGACLEARSIGSLHKLLHC